MEGIYRPDARESHARKNKTLNYKQIVSLIRNGIQESARSRLNDIIGGIIFVAIAARALFFSTRALGLTSALVWPF
jgi:hypothetical protein